MTQTTTLAPRTIHHQTPRATRGMTPVTRSMRTTYIGGPDSGRTRKECWSATSTDGSWSYERLEDQGTTWSVTHLHTGCTCDVPYRSLNAARRATASGATLRDMRRERAEILASDRWPAECRREAEAEMAALLPFWLLRP